MEEIEGLKAKIAELERKLKETEDSKNYWFNQYSSVSKKFESLYGTISNLINLLQP
jgi:chromosome segregation ATPase